MSTRHTVIFLVMVLIGYPLIGGVIAHLSSVDVLAPIIAGLSP